MDNPVVTPFEQAHHDRMVEQRLAIVVGSSADAEALRPFVHSGVALLVMGSSPTMGRRFDAIAMLVKPGRSGINLRDKVDREWFSTQLLTRLTPNGKVTWLAPQWEIER